MKLSELNPKWFTVSGACSEERPHVGVIIDCPACGPLHRVPVNIDPPIGNAATLPHAWQRTGETFDTLTLRPSLLIHANPNANCKGWHGFITNGEAVSV